MQNLTIEQATNALILEQRKNALLLENIKELSATVAHHAAESGLWQETLKSVIDQNEKTKQQDQVDADKQTLSLNQQIQELQLEVETLRLHIGNDCEAQANEALELARAARVVQDA